MIVQSGTTVLPAFSPPTTAVRDRAIPAQLLRAAALWALRYAQDGDEVPEALRGAHLRCVRCGQSVARLSWDHESPMHAPGGLAVLPQQIEDATVAHVLQVHRRAVDPGWSGS